MNAPVDLKDFASLKPFPAVVDNTMLATGRTCWRKYFWEFQHCVAPPEQNIHLHAGRCFASALEAARMAFYLEGKPAPESLGIGLKKLIQEWGDVECPPDEAKSLERMMGALEFYFHTWPLKTDYLKPIVRPHLEATPDARVPVPGGARIEFTFAIPIPEVPHPITGDPMIYAGRTDMIAEHKSGIIFIEDDKTTKSLGEQWMRRWVLRSQFTGYVWAAQQYGYKVDACIIRGISILKTKYDKAEVIETRPQWHLEMWYRQTVRTLQQAIEKWRESAMIGVEAWDMNLHDACGSYGGCPFVKLCDTNEPQNWIEGKYIHRVWEPLKVVV